MSPEPLTKKQRHVLDYIEEFVKEFAYAPSYREIAEHLCLSSVATVHEHIRTLEDKGYIKVSEGSARSIKVIDGTVSFNEHVIELPLAGLITAGEPIEAVEDGTESVSVPDTMIRGRDNHFVLKVKGESMIEEGIFDGDLVIVEKKDSAQNGDTVVALIDGQNATLKKFFKERTRIRLQPANSTMQPMYVTNVQIQGRVVGLLRSYA